MLGERGNKVGLRWIDNSMLSVRTVSPSWHNSLDEDCGRAADECRPAIALHASCCILQSCDFVCPFPGHAFSVVPCTTLCGFENTVCLCVGRRGSSEADSNATVSLCVHPVKNDVGIFAVCRNYRLRMWSASVSSWVILVHMLLCGTTASTTAAAAAASWFVIVRCKTLNI